MYFTLTPKTRLEDLYNYREELEKLLEALEEHKLVILKGIRRVGKTSLAKVAFGQIEGAKAFLDARNFSDGRNLLNFAFKKLLSQIDPTYIPFTMLTSVNIGPFSLSPTPRFSLEEIDKKLGKVGRKAYIFIDEAEHLSDLGKLLAYCYDNTENVSFVLTGSEIGVMENFFTPHAPLFGRLKFEITLHPLPKEKSLEFLRIGFAQIGKEYKDRELNEAVELLDGLIGWLTYYGFLRKAHHHKEALEILKKDAKLILEAEVSAFLEKQKGEKRRYVEILKSLAIRPMSWSMLKESVELKIKKKLSPSRFTSYLKKLESVGFVIEENNIYRLADPLIKLL